MENFADAPVSLAEIKADREGRADLWGPRDALVKVLRDIDNGVAIEHIVVCYRIRSEDPQDQTKYKTEYQLAGTAGVHESLGLLHRVAYLMNE